MIVVHTLDRLGRSVRDTLNLIHELSEHGIGVRNLADPIKVDPSNPEDPMAQLAVVLLALFGQMERTYTIERAAHARAVATAKGLRIGRPVLVEPAKLDHAAHLRDNGHTIAEIVVKIGIPDTSVYRHLPPRPRPAPILTAASGSATTTTARPSSKPKRHATSRLSHLAGTSTAFAPDPVPMFLTGHSRGIRHRRHPRDASSPSYWWRRSRRPSGSLPGSGQSWRLQSPTAVP